jgi:hypothetical protein
MALIYGMHDDEENVLVSALALTRTYDGRILLLAVDPSATQQLLRTVAAIIGGDPDQIAVARRTLWRTIMCHCRAELVITSHVMLSMPIARGNRFHVHVTHGWGPKSSRTARSSETAFTLNSTIWNESHLKNYNKPKHTLVIPGMPRSVMVDRGRELDRRSVLTRLGLNSEQPVVLWAPTYRTTYSYGIGQSREGVALTDHTRPNTDYRALLTAAEAHGVQLVVKPHPVEAGVLAELGLPILSNADIWSAGATPTQLLGLIDGLISDYSSIWVDFLAARRSLLLFCPDLEEFTRDRGIAPPPLYEVADGLLLTSDQDAAEFFLAVSSGRVFREGALVSCRESIGYMHEHDEHLAVIDKIRQASIRHGSLHWTQSATLRGMSDRG